MRESNLVPNETHPSLISALTGSGAGSNAVTRIISWREIAAEQPEAREAGG
jgi:hypothetical protein